jgi:hypothetical protein
MELMTSEQKHNLLSRLTVATRTGSIKWSAMPSQNGKSSGFATVVGRFAYSIKSRDADDLAPYVFSLYQMQSEDSEDKLNLLENWETKEFATTNPALEILYREVARVVLGLDNVLNDMFVDLASVDGLGPDPDSTPF